MISIIIPTINNSLLTQLSKNIKQTIGVEYEIIAFENYKKNWGIAKIYNHCAKNAKYEYLVFCHEDILFHTQDWGKELITLLSNSDISLVGVAGSTYKSKYPAPWIFVDKKFYRTNAKSNKNGISNLHINNPDKNELYSNVVILDGFFLATKKNNWEKIKFDEVNLTGFHYYDIDYSLKQDKAVVVSHRILIEHFSSGNFDKNWLKISIKYHHKNNINQISLSHLEKNEIKIVESNIARKFFLLLLKKQYSSLYSFLILIKIIFSDFFNKNNIRIVLQYFYSLFKQISNFVKTKIHETNKKIINKYLQIKYNGEDFCIISNNCWAGHVYQALNKPYNTPFVGMFINAPDYIKLLQNFDSVINSELKFKLKSKYKSLNVYYPIGVLSDDIEIHFMHYKSEAEAYDKWNRRKERMLKDKKRIFVKFDDRDFCKKEHIDIFHKLDYINKLSFTKIKYSYKNNLVLQNSNDLILLFSTVNLFDIPEWLNTGQIKNSTINKFITKLFPYPVSWTH